MYMLNYYMAKYYNNMVIITLSREVEGLGPMKPGNQRNATVPIPAGVFLGDEDKNTNLFSRGFFHYKNVNEREIFLW